MSSYVRIKRTAVAACLGGVLAMGGSTGAYAARSTTTAPGRSADPDPREKSSGIGETQSAKASVVPHLTLYLNFMEYVGAEDDRIRKEMRSGAQAEKRTDYAQAIGIGKEDEELVLTVVLEAYHQREDLQKQKDAVVNEGGLAAGRDDQAGVAAAQAKEVILIRARCRVLHDMWEALKADLGNDTLRKLDAYVNREFADEPELSTIY